MITVACARTGEKYTPEHIDRLRAGVARHLPDGVEFRFVCLVDLPQREEREGIDYIDISEYALPGRWGKMAVFDDKLRDDDNRWLFFDADTVIAGDLAPLVDYAGPFAACRNFTAQHNPGWPCRYGSACMVLPANWGGFIFDHFINEWLRPNYNRDNPYGPDYMIQAAYPTAVMLQDVMPAGYFLDVVSLAEHQFRKPDEAAIVVFGGDVQPDTCGVEWVRSAWMS